VAPLVGAALQAQQRMQALAIIAEKWTPAQKLEAETIREQLVQMRARFENLQAHRGDALARSQLRALVKEQLGLIEYVRVLEGMIDYFTTDGTGAAFDSEAALLRWNFYPRGRWLANPLCFHQAHSEHPPVCMTMRLDGPQPGIVRDLITASIKAEAQGLQGKAVVDSGGNLTIDAKSASYAAFDQTLRRLAEIIRTKSRVPLVFDQKPEVLPAHSVNQAALYCGWYALRNYTPGCTFTPGAVGYHVASFELTTLRSEGSREWCRGLLLDGIAATLGAVSEPFLNAFPPPDEFFPLLLTGKLPLAEVYWKTCPMVSWQIAMIGDPLYNPYKSDPALAIEALSPPLREAVR
jgi:uncharacterized protein (TIGR03790 family)